MYYQGMARTPTTADVFNAIGDSQRRTILETLGGAELDVGELVQALAVPQPQVSKHLRVLRDVGLVRCDRVGRRRVYRVHGEALRPIHEWVARFERLLNDRYDRLADLLVELQPEDSQ